MIVVVEGSTVEPRAVPHARPACTLLLRGALNNPQGESIVHRIKTFFRHRVVLLLVTVGLVSVLPVARHAAFAEYCGTGFAQPFYSDASETTIVGHCNRDCTGYTRCTGTKTIYSTVTYFNCCD